MFVYSQIKEKFQNRADVDVSTYLLVLQKLEDISNKQEEDNYWKRTTYVVHCRDGGTLGAAGLGGARGTSIGGAHIS